MELCIVGYRELYGWTMDEVVKQTGKKGNCTVCGVFRRQALDRGAARLGVNHVVTGHNADDMAETVLMNCMILSSTRKLGMFPNANVVLRGDLPRLHRCTSIVTESPSSPISRSKPLKYAYEKEIVLYAHHRKLDYFSTECIYSPQAFRGSARALIKSLERVRPSAILDVVRSGEAFVDMVPEEIRGSSTCKAQLVPQTTFMTTGVDGEDGGGCGNSGEAGDMAAFERQLSQNDAAKGLEVEITSNTAKSRKTGPKKQTLGSCAKCGYMSSQELCKACILLAGLNKNRPMQGIEVELGEEEEEASSNIRRKREALEMKAARMADASA
jgi:cytoplasmic tRNA 2-thiolation protein 1